MPDDPTQNSGGNSGGAANLRPFEKGRSGNPGGRPKGLAKSVRDRLDDAAGNDRTGADVLVGFWTRVMADEKEDTGLRLQASRYLAERGWGKPAAFVPIEDDDPLELNDARADELAAEFDDRLDELEKRRRAKEDGDAAATG